jgi:hypothetical protein
LFVNLFKRKGRAEMLALFYSSVAVVICLDTRFFIHKFYSVIIGRTDMQENDDKQFSETGREGWSAEKLAEEGVNQMPDEMMRQILRGDEDGEKADDRDVVGTVNRNETPQGREEAKRDSK